MSEERIIAVGLLTQRDLDRLGKAFSRHFAIPEDDMFADILAKLDRIEVQSVGQGVMIKPEQ